jgi:hypothetical protein
LLTIQLSLAEQMKKALLLVAFVVPGTCVAQRFTDSPQGIFTLKAPLEVYQHLADTAFQHRARQWPIGQKIQLWGYANNRWWGISVVSEYDVARFYARQSDLLTACGAQVKALK